MKKRVARLVEFEVLDQMYLQRMTFSNVALTSMYAVMDCLRQCEVELAKKAKNSGYKSLPFQWSYRVVMGG